MYRYGKPFNLAIDMERRFDEEKVREYAESFGENENLVKEFLMEQVVYVNYSLLKGALLESFNKFVKEIGSKDFYLMLPKRLLDKQTNYSLYWLIGLLWDEINGMDNFRGTPEKPIPEGSDVIIIVDLLDTNVIDPMYKFIRGYYIYNVHVIAPFLFNYDNLKVNKIIQHMLDGYKLYCQYIINVKDKYKDIVSINNLIPIYFDHRQSIYDKIGLLEFPPSRISKEYYDYITT